jgi:uncharacterized protein YjeT (DUF2065 family)
MEALFSALALGLIIEGILPFVSPKGWRGVFEKVLQLSDGQIRFYGMVSMAIGLLLLWLLG